MPTRQERDERRRNGLCMWCGVKFIAGHTCLRSQLYHMLVESEGDNDAEHEEFSDCLDSLDDSSGGQQGEGDRPIIALHALFGTDGFQTMCIQGSVKNQKLVILVDTGSTHNFVDQSVIKRVGAPLQPIASLMVTVANGEKLRSQEFCAALQFEVQGESVLADFFVLPLRGCDMVLGVQWLVTVGPILWDFQQLTMQFSIGARLVKWQGLMAGQLFLMTKKQAAKLCVMEGKGTCALMLTGSSQSQLQSLYASKEGSRVLPPDLQHLLNQYAHLFAIPTGLPPPRTHDHSISLTDETQPVKIRPYRYPVVQKNELEGIVAEMLQAGLIRDITSSFASPVVLD